MREMIEALGLRPGEMFTKDKALDWFKQKYPLIKEGTISAHLIRHSTNNKNRLHHSSLQRDGSDDLFFQTAPASFRLYDKLTDPTPIRQGDEPATSAPTSASAEEGTEYGSPPTASEFAYEQDLRDYLSKNLHLIEPGLRLYNEDDVNGVEFPVGGRFIDILAIDKAGGYVVIELKVSRGHEKTIGQLLRYMGWIEKNHADAGQAVRGVIVAKEATDDLRLACLFARSVSLFEYDLSVSLRPIHS